MPLRTLVVLPFLGNSGVRPLAAHLVREPALLLRLGRRPVQLQQGANDQHRDPAGRQVESLPCHPDTLRDALARVTEQARQVAQHAGVQRLFARRLVRVRTYEVDGTRLGDGQRLVALICVSGQRPLVVAWR